MSYEKELFDEVMYVAAGKLSPNEASDLREWVESLEAAKRKLDEHEKSKHRTHVNDCKAEAFDAILKSYEEASHEGHMVHEFSNIIEKYQISEADTKNDDEKEVYKCTCGARYYSMDNFREHLTNCFDG